VCRGAKKAICAVAASILAAAYYMLKRRVLYSDIGPDYFDRRSKHKQTKHLLKRGRSRLRSSTDPHPNASFSAGNCTGGIVPKAKFAVR
jgi:hypothetical protein